MAKASDNVFPKLWLAEGAAPSTPAAGVHGLFVDTADDKLKRIDSAGTVTTVEGGSSGGGTFTTYTPVLTATTTNPTLGTGAVQTGRYTQIGSLVVGECYIKFGTSGVNAGSGEYRVSLPVAADTAALAIGQGFGYNGGSVGMTTFSALLKSSTTFGFLRSGTTFNAGASVPQAWVAGNDMGFTFTYKAA